MSDLVNEFAFSWSRHRTFYQCARKLYWQHYGFWQGWEAEAPASARLAYRLKQLKSLSMLVGETFHVELAEILRRRTPAPMSVPDKQLTADMERRLLGRLRQSRNADWDRYGDPKNYTILFEDYYGTGVSGELEHEAIETLRRCVDGLKSDGFGRRAFGAPADKLKYIDPKSPAEKRVTIDGLVVYASPDLIVEGKEGGLHIVDWKTGMPHVHDVNAAQLAIYGLFVQQKFDMPLDQITAHLVYVGAGEHRAQNVSEGEPEARRVIATFVADVTSRLTDAANNIAGDIERFPMTTNRATCRSCNFRELCDRLEDAPQALASDED
ncbi:MAG TPA: PD-(D/E)XK nuclease family protein [Candidatus Acidoferrales bacterium]|nr:PD-(D/E)XK nuclease family protein [Candidatus Acidoferrales bacterium]